MIEILKNVLICFVMLLGIGWTAVFICALMDKSRGRDLPSFGRGGVRHFRERRPLVWWQHLIRLPLYLIFIPTFALCCLILLPPMFMVERWHAKP
jgi:hypothetical protein